MKYEAVFGDQSLFDDAPEDAEMAASVCQMPRWYTMFNGKVLFCDSKKESWQSADFNHPGSPLLAMRRIIPDPKRWTLEDKKAGMLPEVGSLVEWNDCGVKLKVTIESAFFNKSCAFSFEGRGIGIAEIFDLSPIETPEEKAQREENEFVFLVESEYNKMPNEISFKAGIRAAYRKLKGGE